MPRIKLNARSIAKLKAPDPSGKQVVWWDAELRGFGVLCSGATNTRSYIAQRDVRGGKTRRVTIAAVNELSLAEAYDRARPMLDAMRQGQDPKKKPATGTLQSVLDAHLAARHELRPTTAREYRYSVERYLKPWLDQPLRAITRDMIEQRHKAIGEDYGPGAANGSMRALRLLWNWQADRDDELPANPVRLAKQWFPQPRRERHVPADKLPIFYSAVLALKNPVARDYITLLLFTGLRRTEAATLTWADVDLVNKVIRVPAARTKAGRKLDLPMSDFVFDVLARRRELGDSGFVFPSVGRKSGYLAEPKVPLAEVAKATGIQISAHDLRRTFVTIAAETDISPWALKGLVNHSLGNNDVTGGYIMMNVERLREPAQRVADRLKLLCGIKGLKG